MTRFESKSERPLLDKLGVRPDSIVTVLHVDDREFLRSLKARTKAVSTGRPRPESDLIFLGASHTRDLSRLTSLQAYLKPNGAIWMVRPKGQRQITEADVMAAGKAAGLVDVKVVRFSETQTAEKFVIPVARRQRD